MDVKVTPDYASISCVADLCEPWIQLWGGDEWGDSMWNLHGACHTDYGFSDEDCALFASKLIENLIAQQSWVVEEGRYYGFAEPDAVRATQKKCQEIRDYWRKGGNLTGFEPTIQVANKTLDTLPKWMFEGPLEEEGDGQADPSGGDN